MTTRVNVMASLTLTLHPVPVDAGTDHHDIVHYRKTALASYPVTLTILETTVGQHSGFVKPHSSAVFCFGQRQLVWMKEVPHRPVHDLIRRVSQYVDDGV